MATQFGHRVCKSISHACTKLASWLCSQVPIPFFSSVKLQSHPLAPACLSTVPQHPARRRCFLSLSVALDYSGGATRVSLYQLQDSHQHRLSFDLALVGVLSCAARAAQQSAPSTLWLKLSGSGPRFKVHGFGILLFLGGPLLCPQRLLLLRRLPPALPLYGPIPPQLWPRGRQLSH